MVMLALQGWAPLHSAVSAGHEAVAALLLQQGADVHATTAGKRTALHYAASKHPQLIQCEVVSRVHNS